MKRPSFQFYPADWRNDAALRMCSLGARGLWWEMICIMHTCEPYGHLVAAGRSIEADELGRIVGESAKDVRKWLAELDRHAIFSRTAAGTIYSRRMLRDEIERGKWRDRQDRSRSKPENVTPPVTPVSHPSSSSTSSSSSSSVPEDTSLRSVAAARPKIEIPAWIPPDAWAGFVEMRRKIRQPLTDRAILLTIAALKRLRATEDIGAVLDQSTMKNYRGVFPVKHEGNGHGPRSKPPSSHDKFTAGAALYIASLGGDADGCGEAESGGDLDRPQLPLLAS